MGIPSYFAHIVKRHRTIIKPFEAIGPIHNLYLDSNSLIYDAVYNLQLEKKDEALDDQIIKLVGDKIWRLVTLLKPLNRLFITFDGVAPLAKMEQQRKRRFMSAYQNMQNMQNTNTTLFNTACITPGTAFMNKLGQVLTAQFADNKQLQVKVSTADEVGEGEHKIFQAMRHDTAYHASTTTVVYGLDADLIMLGLLHNPVYLFRETPEFIKQLDRSLNANELYILDLPELSKRLSEDQQNSQTYIYDYIFMCFFLGNDFLPHFPALNIRTSGIDRLMQTFSKVLNNCSGTSKSLLHTSSTSNATRTIHWKNVRTWLADLAANEFKYLQVELEKRDKQQQQQRQSHYKKNDKIKIEEDPLLNLPTEDRALELYINPAEAGWEARYYSALFDIKIDDERRREICINYLEGLEWTWKYYTTGCPDWRWKYNYAYPPLLTDLIKYVPYFDVAFFEAKQLAHKPVSPYVQLSYVMPLPYLHFLPPTLQERLLQQLGDKYPEPKLAKFLWAFCRYFWEAHVVLPELELDSLESVLAGCGR